jgi:hypothetical protein
MEQTLFYPLPPAVELRVTDDDNYTTGTALSYSAGAPGNNKPNMANLFIDTCMVKVLRIHRM